MGSSAKRIEANKYFIKIADVFMAQANQQCESNEHQLVNALLLYASARF